MRSEEDAVELSAVLGPTEFPDEELRLYLDVTGDVIAQLEDAVAGTRAKCDGVQVEHFLRRGAPWEKLLNVAVEVGADLIVVGATGQRGAASVGGLLGSVAYRVLASSTRSVLISRPPFERGRNDAPV